MSDDPFADEIRRQVQQENPPRVPRLPGSVRAWCVLLLCMACLGVALALAVSAIIH